MKDEDIELEGDEGQSVITLKLATVNRKRRKQIVFKLQKHTEEEENTFHLLQNENKKLREKNI